MSKLDSPKTDTTISEIISDAVHDEATLKDEILWQWPKFDNTSKEQKETKEPTNVILNKFIDVDVRWSILFFILRDINNYSSGAFI